MEETNLIRKIQEQETVIKYYQNELKEYINLRSELALANARVDNRNKIISKMQKNIINKAIYKINSMFDNGDETNIIDDLLELDTILRGKYYVKD